MRKIVSFKEISATQLVCTFDNNVTKKIDLSPFINSEAFGFLKNKNAVYFLTNHKRHLEWQPQNVDLSADTLWHVGN